MAISLNGGTGVITGVSVGGLPDGIVDTDMLAASAVTEAKLANDPQQGLAKAWINFDGTSGSIGDGRDSFNVLSVTDVDPGKYTINFTNNMANANYAVVISSNMSGSNSNAAYERIESTSTSNFGIRVIHSGAFQDVSIVCCAVFGD